MIFEEKTGWAYACEGLYNAFDSLKKYRIGWYPRFCENHTS